MNTGSLTPLPSQRHYPALDGLRGMAALMIVWHHFLELAPMHGRLLSSLSRIFGFTWVGVDLFFVLSGFLITGILADSKSRKRYFRSFYARRVLRIFPLYYGVLVFAFFIIPLLKFTHTSPSSQIFFWTYTSNFYFEVTANPSYYFLGHFWSLAIEEQFYLLWPLIIFFAANIERLRRGLLWAFFSVSLLCIILFFFGIGFHTIYDNTFTHCDALMLGGYLALSIRSMEPGALNFLRPTRPVAALVVIIALLLANFGGFGSAWDALALVNFGRCGILFGLLAIIFVWLVHAASNDSFGRIFKFFSHRALRWFGKYSYALYVLHLPIAILVLRSKVPWTSSRPFLAECELFSVYFGACILAAFLSWHLYEKHFLKLKRYFQPGPKLSTHSAQVVIDTAV